MFIHRELKEESGLVAHTLDKVGVITFEFLNDPQLLDVHVFRTYDYSGKPTESDGEQEGLLFKFWTSFTHN